MRQAPPGIIPFRLRIGVTGHRNITWSEVLVEVPARVREVLPLESVTPVRLGVVSALAEGADRFVVEEVFTYATLRNEDARLEVILPFDRSSYAQAQEFSAEAQAEFAELLDRATSVTELDGSFGGSLDSAYEAASQHVVARSDVLVARWDGQPSRGRGGTAETLLHAAEMGKPCIWLSTDGGPALATNFGEGRNRHFRHDVRRRVDLPRDDWSELSGAGADTLEPIQRAYQEFEAFNSAPMPPEPQLRQRVERELGSVDAASTWVAWPFARAAILADRVQTRFVRAVWLMTACAIGAAASLAVSVSREHPSHAWSWVEVFFLVALVAIFAAMRRARLHARWLSTVSSPSDSGLATTSRRLTSTSGARSASIPSSSRAGRSSGSSAPSRRSGTRGRAQRVRSGPSRAGTRASEDAARGRLDRRTDRISRESTANARPSCRDPLDPDLPVRGGDLVAAAMHALTTFGEEFWIVCTVTLPVAGAALGIVLNVRQHHALAERYERMHSTLIVTRQALLDADSRSIAIAASEAARVIAEENGDWFGSMWFLDVEHPPYAMRGLGRHLRRGVLDSSPAGRKPGGTQRRSKSISFTITKIGASPSHSRSQK